ncbi:unnamed protein product [Clavelina lepadiformis]|uniref:CTCK domain-containing protein n=1 Tax=Clavelina lepadiformis TaxID=159417 RepID=A0ABP0F2N6_CLALP
MKNSEHDVGGCGKRRKNWKWRRPGRTSLLLTFFVFIILMSTSHPCWAKSRRKSDRAKVPCKRQTSSWSACTKSCGVGVSTRVKTKGRCKLKNEARLCAVRPCDEAVATSGKHRCVRHMKSSKRQEVTYVGAKSEKKFKMKFCGGCSDVTKCCTPSKTKTRKIWFRKRDGTRFSKRMMFIRKCRCHSNCSGRSDRGVFTFPLYADTYRDDGARKYRENDNNVE